MDHLQDLVSILSIKIVKKNIFRSLKVKDELRIFTKFFVLVLWLTWWAIHSKKFASFNHQFLTQVLCIPIRSEYQLSLKREDLHDASLPCLRLDGWSDQTTVWPVITKLISSQRINLSRMVSVKHYFISY